MLKNGVEQFALFQYVKYLLVATVICTECEGQEWTTLQWNILLCGVYVCVCVHHLTFLPQCPVLSFLFGDFLMCLLAHRSLIAEILMYDMKSLEKQSVDLHQAGTWRDI